ncbi:MAG: sigma-70 family RNA polymerase sigma factor [Chitinophagaceae bacterium]
MQVQQLYTEIELVNALKEHKNDAYRYLYQHYRGSLFSIISQIITDPETANDVLQEVFITVWKNIEKYNPEKGRLFTWLMKVTRNTAINQTRSKNYKSSLKNENLSNYVNYIDENTSYQQNINLIGLRKQVGLLKSEFKAVLELAYYNGFTQEEVANTLNIPLGTVKTRLRSAVLELKKHFV